MQRKFHENILTISPPLARRVIDKVSSICLMDTGNVPASILSSHELFLRETKLSKPAKKNFFFGGGAGLPFLRYFVNFFILFLKETAWDT